MDRNIWLDGMMGLIVGDALGVPVQFMEKEEIISRENGPVEGMESKLFCKNVSVGFIF